MNRRNALKALVGAVGTVAAGGRLNAASAAPRPSRRPLAMEPFDIRIERAAIEDLHRRIDATRWPEMPFDTGWGAGTSDAVLRELVTYLRNDYDWFHVQAELNQLNHLRGPVGGELMHCVTYAAEGPKQPFPLLLLHGWPSSFHEFSEAAPRLASGTSGRRGFDVVIPSLPGFVFSEAPREPGMNTGRIAERLHLLMAELGHTRYGVQGGDWGAIIGSQLARRYPEAVVGYHTTFVSGTPAPAAGTAMSAEEEAYRSARTRFQAEETGYSSIQGTRPQTLSYAQQDSPVGWLAWMLEKYWAWADHGGDLWSTFDRDALLTTALLYWLPGRVLSAARIYYEASYRPQPGGTVGGRVEVPTAYAHFPREPWGPPRELVERGHNLVRYNRMARGGHFPALEQPTLWAADVGEFFGGLAR